MTTVRRILTVLALSLPAAPALAAAPPAAQATSPAARAERLSRATYVILAPEVQGNKSLISGDQFSSLIVALRNDSGAAIKRRYPGAAIVTDPNTPGAVRVTPVLFAPSALVPWATMGAQLRLDFPEGGRLVVNGDRLSVLSVYGHASDAANFLFDGVARKLP